MATQELSVSLPSLKVRLKDMAYEHLPLRATGALMRLLAPGSSPFGEQIVARQAIFIHVPKAAGTSVKTELYGRPQYGHRRLAEFHAYEAARTARYFKFGFVRNPWDRLLSAYSYLIGEQGTNARDDRFAAALLRPAGDFTGFVTALQQPGYRRAVMAYDHFRLQRDWICLPGAPSHGLDFLGRFERIDADMDVVRERLGLPQSQLDHARRSQRREGSYRDAYTAASRAVVADLYSADIELLGYTF
jgi:hypothetical protein